MTSLQILRVDEVVLIENNPNDAIYELLANSSSIAETKWHYQVLIVPIPGIEGGFPLVSLHDPNQIIGPMQIQLGKILSFLDAIK